MEKKNKTTLRLPNEVYEALVKMSNDLGLGLRQLIVIALWKSFNRL